MKKSIGWSMVMVAGLLLMGCQKNETTDIEKLTPPVFQEVSVHDPSIIKTNDEYYIIGSHMAFAKSNDLMAWQQLQSSVAEDTLFADIKSELAADFDYAKTDTLWAGNIIQLADGRYYMYYCLCEGSSPLAALGVAVADNIDGPYKKIETFLHSGTSPQFGKTYNATVHPNVIDPHVFYDNEGKLWMVYGSYSGGLYILEMDDTTGFPKDRDSYGTKLMGGNHARIEAPYIQYNKDTGYYYLFVSYGGLAGDGGYNIRVSRSQHPDGPYEDSEGKAMIDVKGAVNTAFDDRGIEGSGVKLVGNFTYSKNSLMTREGYVSPGHNSVYYDGEKNQYYVIFHTRFPNSGEAHQVRVHQLWFNEDGWPVMNPLRYGGETISDYRAGDVIGNYSLVTFEKKISANRSAPIAVELKQNGKLTGDKTGSWQLAKNNTTVDSVIKVADVTYTGKFCSAYDPRQKAQVMTFSGTSKTGIPVFLIGEKTE